MFSIVIIKTTKGGSKSAMLLNKIITIEHLLWDLYLSYCFASLIILALDKALCLVKLYSKEIIKVWGLNKGKMMIK